MGAVDFESLIKGRTADEAFHRLDVDKSEYAFLTRTPVSVLQATAMAERELEDERSDFYDKWGPAGCIPVITGTRTILVEDISGSMADTKGAVREAVTERGLLGKGETIESVHLYTYVQPQRSAAQSAYYGNGGTRVARFLSGKAEVVIRTPLAPTTRTAPVTVTVRGSHSEQEATEVVKAALATGRNRLRDGETITQVILESHEARAERTFRTAAVAAKGKTVTRYVVSGTNHSTWATGLPSQAEARAVAVTAAERAPQRLWDSGEAVFDVTAVTRREDGSPLVQVSRTLVKSVYTARVKIVHTPPLTGPADAFLFFGFVNH